ncbi:MAG: carboxypeptidase-like regulatory domain-containing protein [Cyclobacteriaceae bacterium]|nr:carboxypeptidase-like regulatory domain-containing protein [Cyclobacteriaceae bacterium]
MSLYRIIIVMAGVMCFTRAFAQTSVKGTVLDSETKEPIPFVNVYFKGATQGVVTDMKGQYTIHSSETHNELYFSFVGYKTSIRKITAFNQTINVRLEVESMMLKEVVVSSGKVKEKYSNKNNPAVDLVREMISHRNQNRIESYDYVEYEQYEKLQMSLSNPSDKLKDRKIFRKYKFLFENIDSTTLLGKSLLPIYLQENLSDQYYRKSPQQKKNVIKAHQKVSFEEYIDDQGLTTYLNYLYNEIDIYDNNITILTNQFLSPIADLAPAFYKFYLTDTLKDQKPYLAELTFVPRNTAGFLFQGKLYVALDSTYAVRKVDMGVNKNINLNWVKELSISQEFAQGSDGRFFLSKSKMGADFGLVEGKGGIYGERVISIRNFVINKERPENFYENTQTLAEKNVQNSDKEFWISNRHDSLSLAESKVYQNIDSLKKMPSFRRTIDIATLLLAGYKSFGKWEIGPVNTFYSFNPVEGFRLRFGGRSTPRFNEKLYFETYAAYGFKDEKWKYYLGSTYSFSGRSIWRFPLNALRISYQRDTKIPGQELQFVQEDNFLLSFKRGINDKWLYNDIVNIEYLKEFENHFSFKLGLKNWKQTPAGGLHYETIQDNVVTPVENLTTTELSLELRWAPKEQFFQGKLYRVPVPNKYPIITVRGIAGVKGIFNSEYNYQNVAVNIFKRFYISQFGYTDVVLEGGRIFGQVPFPLLTIHRANQSYSYQLQSYNLMNFLEFVSDQYVSLNFDHYFNGFLFNRIPLFKRLKWREVATFKVLYGSIRNENNPDYNSSLYLFPTDVNGVTTTFAVSSEPYMEGSIGIANIFKLIRVDAVKRFSYYDHPHIAKWGIRARFKLDF